MSLPVTESIDNLKITFAFGPKILIVTFKISSFTLMMLKV